MKYPTNTAFWKGHKIRYTWIRTPDFSRYSPITQACGIIFDDNENILIGRQPKREWSLPGGTPEGNESLEQTLKREAKEEVDVEISSLLKLGVQKVEFLEDNKVIYQSRYVAKLRKLLPQTEEPGKGEVWERRFVEKDKVLDFLKWGVTGKAIISDAYKLLIKYKKER